MKPIELEVQWFGQYTASQTIQFAGLDPVFLITGETGAGKTTLFDAMTYALYGCGLGARKAGELLRSQLAGPQDSTLVRFRFEANGATWEVARSPYVFVRLKRTGAAETDKYVTLKRLSGAGSPEVIAPGEVAGKIRDVIGLKYEDFSKILVLPQGEFQQFLAMKTKDRAELLKTLFPVGRHTQLAKLANELVKEVKEKAKLIDAAAAEVGRGELEKTFDAQQLGLTERLALAAAAELVGVEAHKSAVAALHSARTLKGQIDTLAKRTVELANHVSTEPQQVDRRTRLGEGRRAAVVLPFLERADSNLRETTRIQALLDAAVLAADAARAEVDRLRPEAELLPQRDEALVVAMRAADQLGTRLSDLRDLHKARQEAKRCQDAAATALVPVGPAREVEAAAEAAVVALEGVSTERDALAPALAAADLRLQACRLAEADAGVVNAWLAVTKPEGEAKRRTEASRLDQLVDAETAAAARLEFARAGVEADAALLVAAALKPGEPCLACGSKEHPHPRTGVASGSVATAALRGAEQAAKQARDLRETQQRLLGELAARLDAARTHAEAAAGRLLGAGHPSPEGWRDAYLSAQAELAPLKAKDADLARRLAGKATAVAALAKARSGVVELERLARAAQDAAAAAAGVALGAEARVGEVPDLEGAIQSTDAQQRAVIAENTLESSAIKQLRVDWTTAEAGVKTALATATTLKAEADAKLVLQPVLDEAAAGALLEAEFPTAEAARAASVPPRDLEALQRAVSDWDRARAELTKLIAELEQGIAGRAEPDIGALELEAAVAERRATEASEKRHGLESELDELRKRMNRLLELRAEVALLLADKKGLITLAKHLNGEIAPRIDFPTWMLTWWLEQVLSQANRRMRDLSASRYAFRLRTSVVDGRTCAGLDIDVLDTWSNSVRDVNALSGGEKFLASLSLALGLADVVSSRHGGVQLNTLFIDEGFGSLDTATLELAMDLIYKIAETRSVGLISHVEAMQKAIPSQIRVTKSPAGSLASVV